MLFMVDPLTLDVAIAAHDPEKDGVLAGGSAT